jgi:hypothetical protein
VQRQRQHEGAEEQEDEIFQHGQHLETFQTLAGQGKCGIPARRAEAIGQFDDRPYSR